MIPSLLSYDALFLDLGETLIHPRGGVGQIYADAARVHGLSGDPEEVGRAFRQAFRRFLEAAAQGGHLAYGQTEEDARAFWRAVIQETFAGQGTSDQLRRLCDDLYERFTRVETWAIFPDGLALLDAAAQCHLKIALVSNWDVRLEPLLKALGLHDRFDVVVGSYAVGAEKPDSAIFEVALGALGLDRSQQRVLHIGDTWDDDVIGARRLGLDALHLDRHGRYPPAEDRIADLAVLIPAVPPAACS